MAANHRQLPGKQTLSYESNGEASLRSTGIQGEFSDGVDASQYQITKRLLQRGYLSENLLLKHGVGRAQCQSWKPLTSTIIPPREGAELYIEWKESAFSLSEQLHRLPCIPTSGGGSKTYLMGVFEQLEHLWV